MHFNNEKLKCSHAKAVHAQIFVYIKEKNLCLQARLLTGLIIFGTTVSMGQTFLLGLH